MMTGIKIKLQINTTIQYPSETGHLNLKFKNGKTLSCGVTLASIASLV